jgi:hypothetical protein
MRDEPEAGVRFSARWAWRSDPACWTLTVSVLAGEKLSREQIQAFLQAGDEVGFKGHNHQEVYGWVNQVLRQQKYEELPRNGRGLVRRSVQKMTGFSRAQTTCLIRQYVAGEEVKPQAYRRRRFAQRYTQEDVELLVVVDTAQGMLSGPALSGPATQKLLYRAYHEFAEEKYDRLARLSVAQLYRLCKSRRYQEQSITYQPTRPTRVAIGEQRRPEPNG